MTVKQARSQVVRLRSELRADVANVVSVTLQKTREEAVRLSSGPLTPQRLRQLDHPYAKRHGPLGRVSVMPGRTRAVINVGSGEFRSAWQRTAVKLVPGGAEGSILNESEVADYLEFGTELMVRRPITERLEDFVHNTAVKELERAWRRLERRYG